MVRKGILENTALYFLMAVFLVGVMASCNKGKTKESSYLKLVKTAKAIQVSSEREAQFPAVIEEMDQLNLAFRVGGPIHRMYVKEGDYVEEGQLIATMDSRDYEVQKNAIETQVEQLRSEYTRVAELKKRGSVADNDYEKMKAGKEMAEVKLKNAMDQLKDTKLRAPFSGYISDVMFEEGELVNQGIPVVKLINLSSYKVKISVPADVYIKREGITSITCTQEDIPTRAFPLTFSGFNKKANNNGLYTFYLQYDPEPDTPLAPGMSVMVHLKCNGDSTVHTGIPLSAVFEKNGESFVWLVQDSLVQSRKISTSGKLDHGLIQVISGLEPGDEVVSGGLNLLQENENVRVVPPKRITNIGNLH